ncbi:MAG: hypothetical protein JKY17_02210 [Magnetovibrio sp.]|nr:hypothetical protein [Magnetovibrio sp.]
MRALFRDNYRDNHTVRADTLDARQVLAHGVAQKLETLVKGFCEYYDKDETVFRFLLLVQHGQLDKVDNASSSPVKVVKRAIQAGLDCGELDNTRSYSAREATAWVFGIVLQTVTFRIDEHIQGPLSAQADALVAVYNGALGLKTI